MILPNGEERIYGNGEDIEPPMPKGGCWPMWVGMGLVRAWGSAVRGALPAANVLSYWHTMDHRGCRGGEAAKGFAITGRCMPLP
jgi:hypothetical protein